MVMENKKCPSSHPKKKSDSGGKSFLFSSSISFFSKSFCYVEKYREYQNQINATSTSRYDRG